MNKLDAYEAMDQESLELDRAYEEILADIENQQANINEVLIDLSRKINTPEFDEFVSSNQDLDDINDYLINNHYICIVALKNWNYKWVSLSSVSNSEPLSWARIYQIRWEKVKRWTYKYHHRPVSTSESVNIFCNNFVINRSMLEYEIWNAWLAEIIWHPNKYFKSYESYLHILQSDSNLYWKTVFEKVKKIFINKNLSHVYMHDIMKYLNSVVSKSSDVKNFRENIAKESWIWDIPNSSEIHSLLKDFFKSKSLDYINAIYSTHSNNKFNLNVTEDIYTYI